MQRDLSRLYRLNEEIARELERLDRAGHVGALRALAEAAKVELLIPSQRLDSCSRGCSAGGFSW